MDGVTRGEQSHGVTRGEQSQERRLLSGISQVANRAQLPAKFPARQVKREIQEMEVGLKEHTHFLGPHLNYVPSLNPPLVYPS